MVQIYVLDLNIYGSKKLLPKIKSETTNVIPKIRCIRKNKLYFFSLR